MATINQNNLPFIIILSDVFHCRYTKFRLWAVLKNLKSFLLIGVTLFARIHKGEVSRWTEGRRYRARFSICPNTSIIIYSMRKNQINSELILVLCAFNHFRFHGAIFRYLEDFAWIADINWTLEAFHGIDGKLLFPTLISANISSL